MLKNNYTNTFCRTTKLKGAILLGLGEREEPPEIGMSSGTSTFVVKLVISLSGITWGIT